MRQFVIPDEAIAAGGRGAAAARSAVLTGADFHYLAHVRRMRPGDSIPASTADGARYAMTVRERSRDRLSVTLRPVLDGPVPDGPVSDERRAAAPITVAQAVVKPAAMDLIVRQATELGAARIIPVLTGRSAPAAQAHPRLPRWQRIGRSAAQQSGRRPLPAIASPCGLAELLRDAALREAAGVSAGKLVLQPPARGEAGFDLPDTLDPAAPVWLLIGPEGGFSAPELDRLAEAGFRRCSLGAATLRAETAAVAAIVAVRLLWHRHPQQRPAAP